MSLNPAQTAAVETLSGPLLVLAGAGTGKTRVVTYRISRVIQSGVRPSRILAVTFTNKAAREMQTRITELLGRRGGNHAAKKSADGGVDGKRKEKPEISTFHSLCVRILRRHITRLGYPARFAIYDRGDQESVARQVLKEIKVNTGALKPGDLLYRISRWKCEAKRPEHLDDPRFGAKDYLAALAYRRYQKTLKTLGAVDFDDLLLLTEELFQRHPEALEEEAGRFDHLLVDEYQDTNMSQYRIVKDLAGKHRNLCVVGDDDQAIYGWRGAEVTHILGFQKDWPEAKVVRLEENYRSTRQIIEWANRVITFNATRHAKRLRSTIDGEPPRILQCKDGETEAKTVVRQIKTRLETTKRQPKDFAVLFRTNEQPRALEMEFRAAKIPYTLIGGQSFFDRKEVRDIFAYLKVLNRPRDEVALLRILNTPPRGIGQSSVQKLLESSLAASVSVWDVVKAATERGDFPGSAVAGTAVETAAETAVERAVETTVEARYAADLSPKTIGALRSFRSLIDEYREKLSRNFSAETLSELIERIGYRGEIDRLYADPNERSTRWESLGEVVNAAAAYVNENEQPDLQGFLDDTSLAGSDFASGKEKTSAKNSVTLMTLHAAKGLEFLEVYMVGMEEGMLPHHRSLAAEDDVSAVDEERRLCYVGITRAGRRLTLTMALERMKWGKPRPTVPSRFLYEITGQSRHPNYRKAIAGEAPTEPTR